MKSDVIIYVADIERGELGADTVATIQEIKAQTRHEIPWLLVLNCVDRKPPGARQRIKESIMQKHGGLFSGEPWLYSATWALQANERAESSWLNLVKSEILRAAGLRTSLDLLLRCNPTATGGSMLSVGDESRLVRGGLEKDVTSAETMLQNLRLLARDKRRLLRGRFLEKWGTANQALGELSQYLTSRLSAHETGDVDIAQDRIADVLLQSLLDCGASQTVRDLIAGGLTTRELTKEECDYWATP